MDTRHKTKLIVASDSIQDLLQLLRQKTRQGWKVQINYQEPVVRPPAITNLKPVSIHLGFQALADILGYS